MSDSPQVPGMDAEKSGAVDIVGAISERFRRLVRNLLKGNLKRARSLADRVRPGMHSQGAHIAFQNLIEDMAQEQALRNAFINIPSVVPGIGTIISWLLISVEDFYSLDQGITLILALSILSGLDPEDEQAMEDLAILVVGEAYGLGPSGPERDSSKVLHGIMTRLLPQRYVDISVAKYVKAFIKRLLPFKRKSRLLPAGFGIAMSLWHAYDTIVKVGRTALRELEGYERRCG